MWLEVPASRPDVIELADAEFQLRMLRSMLVGLLDYLVPLGIPASLLFRIVFELVIVPEYFLPIYPN